jgi:2'-5' RNA ligase
LIQDQLLNRTAHLQKIVGYRAVRWVNVNNIHLTLKFLGEVHPNQVDQLKQVLMQEAQQATPFIMEIGGLGAFPDAKRPRVLWIGLQAPAALRALQQSLERALATLGYASEDKPFSPHLTIGRVSQKATPAEILGLRNALADITIDHIGTVSADALHLFKSDLQPGGPVYTRLFSARFGA